MVTPQSFVSNARRKRLMCAIAYTWPMMSSLVHFSMVSTLILIDAEGFGVLRMKKSHGGRTLIP